MLLTSTAFIRGRLCLIVFATSRLRYNLQCSANCQKAHSYKIIFLAVRYVRWIYNTTFLSFSISLICIAKEPSLITETVPLSNHFTLLFHRQLNFCQPVFYRFFVPDTIDIAFSGQTRYFVTIFLCILHIMNP